jgi:serine/threonine protein kinase
MKTLMGTIDFMAPEILRVPRRQHFASDALYRAALQACPGFGLPVDVWALGVTVYEALSGRRPWLSRDKVRLSWRTVISLCVRGLGTALRARVAIVTSAHQHHGRSDGDCDRARMLFNEPTYPAVPIEAHRCECGLVQTALQRRVIVAVH